MYEMRDELMRVCVSESERVNRLQSKQKLPLHTYILFSIQQLTSPLHNLLMG